MKTTYVSLTLFVLFNSVTLDNKLNIEILFESLCPDSLRFIREQLYPNWKDIAPYVNLKLVPFGKSVSLEDGTFICQHGPQECKGNRIMSCALNIIPDQSLQVEYVHCFMDIFKKGRNDPEEFGQLCSATYGIDFKDIQECYYSKEGALLQLKAEQDTVRILPKFIPSIVYDGEFSQHLQDESLRDFRRVVCNLLSSNFSQICM